MTARFRPPEAPNRTVRALRVVMAILHLVLAGMLMYLRWGPIAKALERFQAQGTEIPALLSLGLTFGIVAMAVFLLLRGARALWGGKRRTSGQGG